MTETEQGALGRRDRKKQRTRAALAAAALRLVAERGLEQVTVEEISEAVDVSARTFFNYFATKDEALVGDQQSSHERVLARLVEIDPAVPSVRAVREALAEVIEEMQTESRLWFLRMRVVAENPALLSRLVTGNATAVKQMTKVIAARCGLPPTHHHPALVAAVTSAAFRTAMIHWAEGCGARPLPELVEEAFSALAAGLPDPQPDP